MSTLTKSYRELNDANISIVYSVENTESYYDAKRDRIVLHNNNAQQFRIFEPTELALTVAGGNLNNEARLYRLFLATNRDNVVCVRDTHRNMKRPAVSEHELMEICACKERTWRSFKNFLKKNRILFKSAVPGSVGLDGKPQELFLVNPIFGSRSRTIPLWLYSICREEIDPFINPNLRTRLHEKLEEKLAVSVSPESMQGLDAIGLAAESEYSPQSKTADEHMDSFQKTVLRNKQQLFRAPSYGKMLSEKDISKQEKNLFYLCQESSSDNRKAKSIFTCRMITVDIDCGEKEKGKYFPLETIEERKENILSAVRPVIPTPSAIVNSRDGFHLIWATEKTSSIEEWLCTAQLIKNAFAGLCDPVVTTDRARILRYPYSVHHKADKGFDPYLVTLLETNDIIYDYSELTSAFVACASGLNAAKEKIDQLYPEIRALMETSAQKNEKKKPQQKKAVCSTTSTDFNEHLKRLSVLDSSLYPFTQYYYRMSRKEAVAWIKEHADIAQLLHLPLGESFDCIFHKTPGGDGKSATIYAPDSSCSNYRYICHCLEKPADIFEVLWLLSGKKESFDKILFFLCDMNGIRIMD